MEQRSASTYQSCLTSISESMASMFGIFGGGEVRFGGQGGSTWLLVEDVGVMMQAGVSAIWDAKVSESGGGKVEVHSRPRWNLAPDRLFHSPRRRRADAPANENASVTIGRFSSLRYRDVKESMAGHLVRRRSRPSISTSLAHTCSDS